MIGEIKEWNMEFDNLIEAIEQEYAKSREAFFRYAWREKIKKIIADENKYVKLVEWVNEKITSNADIVNIFNPADKHEGYTVGFLKNYKDACGELAMLLNFKGLLLDERSTTTMRENIEYAICQIFKIKYNEDLELYQ